MLLFGSSAWILALSVKAQQSGVLVRDLEQVRDRHTPKTTIVSVSLCQL